MSLSANQDYELAAPKPEALIESLRAVGYTLETAMADIIDNSIAASASNVWIHCMWDGADSFITIRDDGDGMDEKILSNAMRPGSQSPLDQRSEKDLGRFGLGLKTASFSQARTLTVLTKTKKHQVPFLPCRPDHTKELQSPAGAKNPQTTNSPMTQPLVTSIDQSITIAETSSVHVTVPLPSFVNYSDFTF